MTPGPTLVARICPYNDGQEVIDAEIETLLRQLESLQEHTASEPSLDNTRPQCRTSDLLERVRCLHERRNYLSPVHRLPPEVLSSIFCMIVFEELWFLSFPQSHSFVGVCRRWRQVALGAAILWTEVPRLSRELTEIFLSRAKSMTLYIGISPPLSICGRPTADARSTALRNLDRAERLIFHGYEKDRSDEVHLSRSAPKLVRCVVDLEGGRVPHNFLGLYTPQLRSLELSNTRFDWDMISCKSLVGGLTLLKLEKLPKACCPSARELTAALMSMPVLRELKIDVYRYSGDDTPRPVVTDGPIGVVALEQLVSLSITGPRWLQIQTWLAHMKVARTAWLVLKPNPFQFDVVDPSALIAFLEDNVIFGGEEGAAVHRLVLHVSYTAVNRLDADRKRDPGGDWPYLLHLEGWFDTDRTLRALYKMRYDAMEFLELSLPPYFNPLHIRHILHRSPNLRELHLRGLETCNVVMPFLTVGTGEDSDGSSSDMPLPALGRIQLTVPQYEREEPHQGCLDLLVARFHASGPAFELVLQGVQHLPRRELRRVRRAVGDAEMLYMRNSGTLYVRKGDCALLPQDLAY